MRYLGKVAGLFDQIAEFPVSMMGDLLKEEMVARACKGILRAFLKVTPIHFVGACISHFFNCLFASEGRDVSVIFTNEHQKLVDQDWQALTTDSLKEMVISLVNQKFRYKMAAPLVSLSVPLLRSVCNKVGIQIEARDYSFGKSNCFQPEDILNIYPILKHALPKAAFAEEALDQGQAAIAQDKKVDGQELVRESLSMHEQIYGPIHPETAKSYGIVAMQNYENEKYDEAIAYQTRAAIVAERTLGLDDAETILQFVNDSNLDQPCLLPLCSRKSRSSSIVDEACIDQLPISILRPNSS